MISAVLKFQFRTLNRGKYYCQILWQASVNTQNMIGCGISLGKLYHLAR